MADSSPGIGLFLWQPTAPLSAYPLMSANHPTSSTHPTPKRLPWLDWFRGLAVLAMIWVHTANSLLSSDLQTTPWFAEMTFWHGLIAPSFFWISGFTRGLLANPQRPPGPVAVRRLVTLLLLGYALHFPLWALFDGNWSPATWKTLWQVDVLHALAMTGFIFVAIERLTASRSRRAILSLTLLALFVGLTHSAAHWQTGWLPLDAWLNNQHGSLFPLFPWVGFGLAGFLCGQFSVGPSVKNRIAQLAVVGSLLALLLPRLHLFDSISAFFLQRLGWVLVFAGCIVWLLAPALNRLPRLAHWIGLAGRESLFLYVIHLLLLFSIPFPGGTLTQHFGLSQPLPATLLWFLLITLACLTLTWTMVRLRKRRTASRSDVAQPISNSDTHADVGQQH